MAAAAMTHAMASLSMASTSTSSRISVPTKPAVRSTFLSARWQPKIAPLTSYARSAVRQPITASADLADEAVVASVAFEQEPGVRYPPFPAFKIHGTGRRKTAVARVGLIEGSGKIFINRLPLHDYFQGQALMIQAVKSPLASLGYETKYDLVIKTHGGGLSAQAQAMVLGIARALCEANIANRPPLKAQGMLTRDARKVERKKYGLHKARKAPQFSKR